jgi:hypothetical protein
MCGQSAFNTAAGLWASTHESPFVQGEWLSVATLEPKPGKANVLGFGSVHVRSRHDDNHKLSEERLALATCALMT